MKNVFIAVAIIMLFGSLVKPDSKRPCGDNLKIKYYKKGTLVSTRNYGGNYWVSRLQGFGDIVCDSISVTITNTPSTSFMKRVLR